jgi:hypothetical protein
MLLKALRSERLGWEMEDGRSLTASDRPGVERNFTPVDGTEVSDLRPGLETGVVSGGQDMYLADGRRETQRPQRPSSG